MGCELDNLLCEAWGKVGARVLGDEGELKARLARRRMKTFVEQTPRVFCLAVRAADRRINVRTAAVMPRWAVESGSEAEHVVRMEGGLLGELVRPVRVGWPGQTVGEVAEMMGCSADALRGMCEDGRLSVRRVKGLGGAPGWAVPVVYSRDALDPCSQTKVMPHRLFAELWEETTRRVPWELEQELRRVPWWRGQQQEEQGARSKAQGRDSGRGEAFGPRGDGRFMGWKWICPGCGEEARVLYLPVGSPDWAGAHRIRVGADELDEVQRPAACFGCVECVGVVSFSTKTRRSLERCWDHFIMHCSGGLLYGKEVRIPEGMRCETAKERRLRQAQEVTAEHEEERRRRRAETEEWDRRRMEEARRAKSGERR